MAKVKLIKGLSYTGIVSATKKEPIVEVADELLEEVLATGYFQLVPDSAGAVKDDKQAKKPGKKPEPDVVPG